MDSLQLLQSYFKGEHFEFEGDVKNEIKLQNKQSLAPYLYFVYGKPFFKTLVGATIIQEKFFALQKELTKLFNENKIKHYYLKGSVLASLYPNSALRTRGDIDVVVEESNYDKGISLLKDNGFISTDKTSKDTTFTKNGLEIELHKKLIESGRWLDNYFLDGFNHTTQVNDYEYKLNNEFHYIYLVFHLNKHLKTGEGLRSLLDFYYLDKAYKLDYTYIEDELKKLDLYQLYQTICNCIFVIANKKLHGYNGADVTNLLNYMLTNGIHGICDSENYYDKLLTVNNESKAKHLWHTLFINKEKRKDLYPRLSKCILFYPIIITHRFFFLLFKRNNYLKKFIKSGKKNKKYDKSFFDNYGIIDR